MASGFTENKLVGIIFDCDGVMIDSEDANRSFYNTILKALNLPPMTAEQEQYSFMATAGQALRKLTPESVHPRLGEIVASTIDYQKDILPKIKLMPDFLEFLRKSHDLGLKMAIDTNRTAEGIQRVLDFFALPPYFNPIISASVAEPKPSPQGVEMVCKTWGVSPGSVLFVGDSEDDMRAARAGGSLFAAFGPKGLPGDFMAPTFQALETELWPVRHK